ncbi:FAD-dependent oxidoreductase [Paenibacillus senegalensis]|uniref:FAD-dependent oxidoreductase n=1 Tax=Paenibacillus senegalensis TaxID=1465766 RepID=UPI0002885E2C|nr:FAD-dependent oxidoreductase [Paenibacillus senegalensis]
MKRKTFIWAALAIVAAAIGIFAIQQLSSESPSLTPPAAQETASPSPPEETSPSPTPEPIEEASYDIVLIGSEMEGMYLARAAKDEGLDVIVLDPRDGVGGQLLQGEMLFLDETRDGSGRLLVQGRAKELFDGFRAGRIRKLSEFTEYYEQRLAQDIPIHSGVRIESVETAPGLDGTEALAAIVYETADGSKQRVTASYWVENSDFGGLTQHLNVERMPGLEGFFGSPYDIEYMSSGMMMKFKNVDWQRFNEHFNSLSREERNQRYGYGSVNESYAIGLQGMTNRYTATNDRVFLRGLNAVNQRDGEVIINAFLIYTVDPSDDESIAEAMELGKAEIPLILEHFRENIVGWENAELNGFPSYLYIREFDHYETDYVLQVSDLMSGRMYYDNVSIGGYPLDLQGVYHQKWGTEMGRPDKYGMPLRSFLLKGYENVIMAGKNVGSSALAYGSARIQPNTALAAETIGIILAQIDGEKKLRELVEDDWPALHAYLESEYNLKLTGVQAENRIAGWTEEEIRKLNAGEIIYPLYIRQR